jgi:hypothetical protein
MIKKNFFMKAIALLVAFFLCIPYGFAEVGKITYIEGRVDIFKAGSDTGVPAREYESISVGDSIRTKSNSKAEVTFKDDSVVRLAQNSKVDIENYELTEKNKRKSAALKLDRGKIRTLVAKMEVPADFAILTPNSQGKITGSDIFTFYQAGSSTMLVADGKMSVASSTHLGNPIEVTSGNSALVPLENLPQGPRPFLDIEKKLYEQDTDIPVSAAKTKNLTLINAHITKFSGEVKVTNKGQTKARQAKLNEVIKEGDLIETGKNGLVEIRLDNNNAINMKPESKLLIVKLLVNPQTGEFENIFELTIGKIKARIEGLKGKSKFEVKTPLAICGARGTILYVDASPNLTTSFLEGGNGYIINNSDGTLQNIPAGEQGFVTDQGLIGSNGVDQQDRQSLTEGWEPGSGVEGYSSPEGSGGTDLSGSGTNNNIGGGTNTDAGTDDGSNDTATGGTVDVPFTESNPTTPTTPTNPTFNLGIFETTNNTLAFSTNPSFWQGLTSAAVVASGSFTNPNGYTLWQGDLDVTLSDGTRICGGLTGIDDALEGLTYVLYIRPNGETGYLKLSDILNGIFDPLSGTFTANADITAYPQGTTTLTPAQLYYGSPNLDSGTESGKVGGDFSGTISIEHFGLAEPAAGGGTECVPWGVWRSTSSGTYTTMPKSYKSVSGGTDNGGHSIDYWLLHTNGTTLASGSMNGTVSGTVISYDDTGSFDDSRLGILSGSALGTYGLNSWQTVGCGTFNETPLAFGGKIWDERYNTEPFINGVFGIAAPASLWSGSPQATIISDFSLDGQSAWQADLEGRTADGAKLLGFFGGINQGNSVEGGAYAMYVRPDPLNPGQYLTGYIKSTNLSGTNYSDIEMLEATADFTAVPKGAIVTAILPSDLYYGSSAINLDDFSAKIGGDIISTSLSGESLDFNDPQYWWSLWHYQAQGTYSGTLSSNWSADFGGHNHPEHGPGFWVGHTSGTEWANGKLKGTISGVSLSYPDDPVSTSLRVYDLGTFSGDTIGTYNNGSWQAVGYGASDGTQLNFGAQSAGQFGTYDAVNNTFTQNGSFKALLGGTDSLWAGNAQGTILGEYSNPQNYKLWADDNFSGLTLEGSGTAAEGGRILGLLGGVKNSLHGLAYALYVRPDPANPGSYLAGYVKSNDISGTFYSDIGMFEATGNLSAYNEVSTTILPSQLYSGSPYLREDTDNLADGIGYITGDISGTAVGLKDYHLISDPNSNPQVHLHWGIWSEVLGGTFSGSPSNNWQAVMGMKNFNNGNFSGYSMDFITGSKWAAGGDLSATFTGVDLDRFSGHRILGNTQGDIVGFYTGNNWQALRLGAWQDTPLLFGGEVLNPEHNRFGYYDTVTRDVELEYGSLSYLFGGTESLWSASPAQVTFMGEFTNPDHYKLWGCDSVVGETTDGAKFLGTLGGSSINNILKGMSVMLYVRPNPSYNPSDPTSKPYLAGYLRSNDIGGNFYQDIGMLYATGHYTHYLDVPTNILPSQLYEGSPYVVDDYNSDSYSLIAGDVSGVSDLGINFTWLESSGTWHDWNIWRAGAGGTFNGSPANNWHAVFGGRLIVSGGAFRGYQLGEISGDGWSQNSLAASVNGIWIEKFEGSIEDGLGTFEGNLLGSYETNPNTWQALAVGVGTDNRLAFGGEFDGGFGYYDYAALDPAIHLDNGSFTALIGGTNSLWGATPTAFTLIGEFANSGTYKLWADSDEKPFSGHTSDGASFFGLMAGVKLDDNSLKGLSYAFYVRPVDGGYRAGYLKSNDISGNFYSSIGMFKANGTFSHYLDLPTTITPAELYDESPKIDYARDHRGLISGSTFSGSIGSGESAYLSESADAEDEWGLWWQGSGGTYTSLPTPGSTARVGGWSFDEDTGRTTAYWLGTSLMGEDFSGTADITVLTGSWLGHATGDTVGIYNSTNHTWEAVSAGVYMHDIDLTSSGRFVAQGWNIGEGSPYDFAGLIGLTGKIWGASDKPGFVSIGELTPPDPANPDKQFAWYVQKEWYYPGGGLAGEDGFVSRFYDNDDPDTYYYTTYNDASGIGNGIGAFYGLSAGVGGAGKLKGKSYALYISPTGAAGTLSGDVDGNYYANVETYRLAGELTKNLHTPNIGISAENLRVNICWDNLIGTDDSGEFGPSGGPYFGDITANGFNGTMLNIAIPNATWGVWNFVTSGDYTGPIQNAWHIYDLTGMTTTVDDNYVGGSWYGGILGNKWNSTDGIEGTLDAMWIGLRKDGTLCGRKITGDAVGNYVEVSVDHGTWQAGAAGEWVELNADLTMGNLNQNIIDLSTAANVPVTVAYSSIMTGAGTGGITSATMDMRLYGVGVADGIWAAIINGYYSNVTNPAGWSATVVNGSDSVTLTGTQWDIGQWAADVVGTAGGNNLTGQAAGTYNPGDNTFTGAGTGTYTTP